ncbi:MAG: ABC transporter permease [Methanocorpusculum sp.]|nr:ABC transporter permease [Oscillospiraceae bacterium]MBQ3569505.1 ABC transporter permease [Methanocorpusculum sp.]
MRRGFYTKLAWDSIRKNKRLYIPYLLTCIGMVMMFYIILSLSLSPLLNDMAGGRTAGIVLDLGSKVIGIFALIFLFYTNSFLIRRRKKEFGLYNILGMGKKNISRIVIWEAVIVAFISLAAGLFAGIALYKLAELGFLYVMHTEVTYAFSVSFRAVTTTLVVFAVIFLLILLHTLWQLRSANAITLLRSENAGEKPPKGNWLFGFLGLGILIFAYYTAVTIEHPLSALGTFFFAVALVIVATYLLFISGSVLLCRILQKRKSYYYKPNHFVSVSSMAYRMKRNGAGLASICILVTMVLVMISATASLNFGAEDGLRKRFPRDINIGASFASAGDMKEENLEYLRQRIVEVLDDYDAIPVNLADYRTAALTAVLSDGVVRSTGDLQYDSGLADELWQVYFIPLEDYNITAEKKLSIPEGKCAIYLTRGDYAYDTITVPNGPTIQVAEEMEACELVHDATSSIMQTMYIILPNYVECAKAFEDAGTTLWTDWEYSFDLDVPAEQKVDIGVEVRDALLAEVGETEFSFSVSLESREAQRQGFFQLYGCLFYLGIMLSLVFICAAVLIIYYKQISEGYEDQQRFEIMQKVGMTKREIRKSINSQMLTVFFLPLITAAIHLCFAFPLINKLLLLFNLDNVLLFVGTCAVSLLVFGVFYVLVYRITSNAYFKIVSGQNMQ